MKENIKLCKDCKHSTFGNWFCDRPLGTYSPLNGRAVILHMDCNYERIQGECGIEAKYFEEKVFFIKALLEKIKKWRSK